MNRKYHAFAAALTTALMVVGLGACNGQVPSPSTGNASSSAVPDVTQAQEKRIRTRILDTLSAANDARNTDDLGQVLTGPQLQIRTSEIDVAKATGNLDKKTTIPTGISQVIVPTDAGWPRHVFTITTVTDDQQSQRLLVMTQDAARQNYKLWGVARLFAGVELPKFAIPSIGSSMGKSDDGGLVATPKEAVERYADVLQHGSDSKYASQVDNDAFRQEIDSLTAAVQAGMERNNGTQQQTFSAVPDALRIMRSSDGGDLVVAQINSEWTRQAGEGRESLPASDAEKALFGDGKATSTMKVTYVNVIALYVPPAGSGKHIMAVGAERQPIKVEAL